MIDTPLDLYALKRERGGKVYDAGRRWSGPGPGHSRRDRSLSVYVADDGRPLIHSFAGDSVKACAAALNLPGARIAPMSRSQAACLREAARQTTARRGSEALAFCDRVWSGAEPIAGTPAETYLGARWIVGTPDDVRFHPNCPRGYRTAATAPALLALVRSVTGAPMALQATFLAAGGGSPLNPRITFGSPHGGAVRLVEAEGTLAVAEGLETAASFTELLGLPCWATLGTANLEAFQLPSRVRHLVIAADGDPAGMKAARALAGRARSRCDVTIRPAPEGRDWNDIARAVAHG